MDFDGLDYNVYEVLEAENFDLWTTPSVSHGGGMDRRAKVVKRKGRFTKQTKTHDIDNEFIVCITLFNFIIIDFCTYILKYGVASPWHVFLPSEGMLFVVLLSLPC